jgi:peroxiredoxin (alkyl hydroperoxide reductase subunit C)
MRTHTFKKGEVCPANWEAGKEAMSADRSTAEYLSLN